MRLAALLIALALPLSAQTVPPPEAKAPTGEWRVIELGALPTGARDDVNLRFDAEQVSGRTGCNGFSAALQVEPAFGLGPMAMTRMLCHGRAGDLEALFTRLVPGVDGWRMDGGTLELLAGERVILRAQAMAVP